MKLREWENNYWTELGERATDSAHRGDQAELYEIYRELKIRGRKTDGGHETVADVEREQEAWKTHFEEISKGRGQVNECILRQYNRIPGGGRLVWRSSD
jgi:hypothetical protein